MTSLPFYYPITLLYLFIPIHARSNHPFSRSPSPQYGSASTYEQHRIDSISFSYFVFFLSNLHDNAFYDSH